jgi:tetratricopeptide (TPR) repeat protein
MGFHRRVLTVLLSTISVLGILSTSFSQVRSTDMQHLQVLVDRIKKAFNNDRLDIALAYSNEGLEIIQKGTFTELFIIKHLRGKFYYYRARCNGIKGDEVNALEDFNLAVQNGADDQDIYFWRGRSYLKLDKYSDAIKDFSKSIELQCETANSYYFRGRAYSLQDSLDAAIQDYSTAVTLGRIDTSTYFDMAGSYLRRSDSYLSSENYKQSANDFKRAMQLRSKFSSAYYHQILSTLLFGNIREAPFILNTVLTLDSNNHLAHELAGFFNLSSGELSLAEEHFNYCLNRDSTNWNVTLGLAATFLAKGDTLNCRVSWHRALHNEPKLANGIKELKTHYRSSSYLFYLMSPSVKSLFESVFAGSSTSPN